MHCAAIELTELCEVLSKNQAVRKVLRLHTDDPCAGLILLSPFRFRNH
jgi:hypothetical protein